MSSKPQPDNARTHPLLLLVYIALLALLFANVEIQIEGPAGWAENLPTWRITDNLLIGIFWGGRPFTGYHCFVFAFMAAVFHLPLLLLGCFSWRLEARVLGALAIFWITEDFLWFVLNPAYGAARLFAGAVPWHKYMFLGLPHDYWIFIGLGAFLFWWSFRSPGR